MKRVLITLMAAVPLSLGAAVAYADNPGTGGGDGGSGSSQTPVVAVSGTIVSVNAAAGTFVANAAVVTEPSQDGDQETGDDDSGLGSGGGQGPVGEQGPGGGQGTIGGQGSGGDSHNFSGDLKHDTNATTPAMTQVTITTNSSTKFRVGEQNATISDLASGDQFVALFNGSPGTDIQTLVTNNPALSVSAETPMTSQQLFAFVGTVTAVDPTGGTVTVNVQRSLPSALVPSGSPPVSFTVSSDTMILGGSMSGGLFGGSLSNVSVGDIVAGGLIANSGKTLSQIEATPLRLLLDLPASSASTTTTATAAKAKALRQALALLGDRSSTKKHKSHKRGKRSHAHKHAKRG
jgi:hypothetical protein